MEVIAGFLIILAFVTTISPIRDVPEDEVLLYTGVANTQQALKFHVKPHSVFKDEFIVKQQFDYSCGSAALATLLNSYLGESITEEQVIQGMMEYGDAQMIEQRRAFSLLDMKQFVSVLGYQGAGYTAEIEDMKALDKPCIVPIEFYGYKHFVVYRGTYADHMFFADPFMGNISFTTSEFGKMWHKNIIFMVTSEDVKFNAMSLKEQDLRLVWFRRDTDFSSEQAYSDIVKTQHRFMESIGRTDESATRMYQFKNVKVH